MHYAVAPPKSKSPTLSEVLITTHTHIITKTNIKTHTWTRTNISTNSIEGKNGKILAAFLATSYFADVYLITPTTLNWYPVLYLREKPKIMFVLLFQNRFFP